MNGAEQKSTLGNNGMRGAAFHCRIFEKRHLRRLMKSSPQSSKKLPFAERGTERRAVFDAYKLVFFVKERHT